MGFESLFLLFLVFFPAFLGFEIDHLLACETRQVWLFNWERKGNEWAGLGWGNRTKRQAGMVYAARFLDAGGREGGGTGVGLLRWRIAGGPGSEDARKAGGCPARTQGRGCSVRRLGGRMV